MLGKPRNMAVYTPLYASYPLYKRERTVVLCHGASPLFLGRLKFNSGTAALRGCQIAPSSTRFLSPSLATVRYRTFDLYRTTREDFRRGIAKATNLLEKLQIRNRRMPEDRSIERSPVQLLSISKLNKTK